MTTTMTKQDYIRKAKKYQNAAKQFLLLNKLLLFRNRKYRKEIRINTRNGSVPVLLYGFQGEGTKPVYFDLHGGGFVFGNTYMDEKMNLDIMQKAGCRIISIDYAKAPDNPYPAAADQVFEVVEYFYKNAETYRIDTDRMAIGGHSAGGNLSTVTCMKAKGKFRFRCQILDYPPLDLATDPYEKPQPEGCIPPEMALMFNNCYVDADRAKDPYVSPVFADKQMLQGLPPALVILAGRDSLDREGQQYIEKMKDAGIKVTSYRYENEKHGFTYTKSEARNDAVNKMAEYLIKALE